MARVDTCIINHTLLHALSFSLSFSAVGLKLYVFYVHYV